MDFVEVIKTRRSVRKFKDKNVSDKLIEEIIDAGRLAPSGNNLQPVEFIVIKDKNKRKEIAGLATYGSFIEDAPVCIAVCSKKTEHDVEDGSAATENILLAAHALGLASCWVAGYKKDYSSDIEDLLEMPEEYVLISLLPIGYPIGEPGMPRKRSLQEVMHKEKF
ncbi:MAG: nitroreductase family protein [Bacillota bacterium]